MLVMLPAGFLRTHALNRPKGFSISQHAWLEESISPNLPKSWHKESNEKFEQPMRKGSNMSCYRCLWLNLQVKRCIASLPGRSVILDYLSMTRAWTSVRSKTGDGPHTLRNFRTNSKLQQIRQPSESQKSIPLPQSKWRRNPSTLSPSLMARPDLSNLQARKTHIPCGGQSVVPVSYFAELFLAWSSFMFLMCFVYCTPKYHCAKQKARQQNRWREVKYTSKLKLRWSSDSTVRFRFAPNWTTNLEDPASKPLALWRVVPWLWVDCNVLVVLCALHDGSLISTLPTSNWWQLSIGIRHLNIQIIQFDSSRFKHPSHMYSIVYI